MAEDQGWQPASPPPPGDPHAGVGQATGRYINAARALSLGALLSGRRQAIEGIEPDVERIGVPLQNLSVTSWGARRAALDQSDSILRSLDIYTAVAERENQPRPRLAERTLTPTFPEQRISVWRSLRQNRTIGWAYAWLRILMAEDDPLITASASSALSHWRSPAKGNEGDVPAPLKAARANIESFVNDSDELVGLLGQATTGLPSNDASRMYRPWMPEREKTSDMSLVIHGTFAWDKDWWLPGGDFHEFAKSKIKPNLYAARDMFSWSGRYRTRDREVAAERLAWWLEEKGSRRVDTIFAHSYGGAVALQSTTRDVAIDSIVLLSVPVDKYEVEWRNIRRAVSLRIHCDLVLLAARSKQRFTANVDEYWLDSWFVHHASSHDAAIWDRDDWAGRLGLA